MPCTVILLLAKRARIDTVIDPFKNSSQIKHSRHRSAINFVVNKLTGLIAYSRLVKELSLRLGQLAALPV